MVFKTLPRSTTHLHVGYADDGHGGLDTRYSFALRARKILSQTPNHPNLKVLSKKNATYVICYLFV